MENINLNNDVLPKEIQSDNDKSNPLLDLISNIQEKLETPNLKSDNENITYSESSKNSTTENLYNNQVQNNGFDTSKIFEILNNLNSNSQNHSTTNNSSSTNIDINAIMAIGKIFSNINKEDPRKNLLLSLKPFLRDNRQKNVDTYIFIIGILNALDAFNNESSGL